MTSAQQAINEVLIARLKGANPLWGERVQPLTVASAQLAAGENGDRQSYVVFFPADNRRAKTNPSRRIHELMMSVKGVAGEMADALAISDAITALLHDCGELDATPALVTHPTWRVKTVTEGRQIYIEEPITAVGSVFHAGHQYEIVMEER